MGRLRTQIMIEDQPRLGLPPTMSNVGDKYPAVLAIVEERLQQAAAELGRPALCRTVQLPVAARRSQSTRWRYVMFRCLGSGCLT